MTPRKPKKMTMTITVRVDPHIAIALDQWAQRTGRYVYEAVEVLVDAGLKSFGTTVDHEFLVSQGKIQPTPDE